MRTEFICQQCGYKSPSFLGKCPECGQWNSLVESIDLTRNERTFAKGFGGQANFKLDEKLFRLADVRSQKVDRFSTGFEEFNRVLGGGVVKGSIVLIAGDPGIGKSTLLLQSAMEIARSVGRLDSRMEGKMKDKNPLSHKPTSPQTRNSVLYVTGEESALQVRIRADRIVGQSGHQLISSSGKRYSGNPTSRLPDNLYILPETSVENVIAASNKLEPKLLIIDSIQTLSTDKLTGSAGSVGQLRECAQMLQRLAKSEQIAVFLVGHVTKEGSLAGPKVLEHLVDAVLNLEGDDMHTFRLLRTSKNRFGSTFEVGVFEMQDKGMVEVSDPSGIFLEQRLGNRAGSCVVATIAGGRPILAEIQALCTSTIFPVPTRRFTGLDYSRIQVVIAALSKFSKLQLANLDIYVNVAGGLKIFEPAADLGAALAVVSACLDKPVREGICAFGEVGLLGELRRVANSKARINEAKRMGFSDFATSEKLKTLEEAIGYAVHGK